MKWQVKMSNEASRDLDRLSKGVLTEDDRIVIRAWAERILTSGPEAVRTQGAVWKDIEFKDHELHGEWAGHRASSYNKDGGRIIYKIEEKQIRVIAVRITAIHDYSKGKK